MTALELEEQEQEYQIGDRVIVKRNLDHPVWKRQERDETGDLKFVPDPDVPEVIGEMEVIDLRRRYGGALEVRCQNRFWYDAATGFQRNSDATIITPATTGGEL